MACNYPLHAFQIGINEKTGKPKYQIESGRVERIHPRKGNKPITDVWITDYKEIPCGKCTDCRLAYSREWATRCMLEARYYEHNQFVTLTYDPEKVPLSIGCDLETGEICEKGTLVPDDLKKFMKDLRRYYEHHYNHTGIRFYACGEYGSKEEYIDRHGNKRVGTARPHFHLIIFNLPVKDKEYFFTNKNHDRIYTSQILFEKIWKKKGIVGIGDVTFESAAYVARYVMKKLKGPNAEENYKLQGIEPEFVRMSRKPGIAYQFFEENKDKIYDLDEIWITNNKGLAQKVKPSKYYDRLFDLDSPEAMKAIKERRAEAGKEAMDILLQKTSLSKEEYLELRERNREERAKKLLRII